MTAHRLLGVAGALVLAACGGAAAPSPSVHSGVEAATTSGGLPFPAAPATGLPAAAPPPASQAADRGAGLDLRVIDDGVAAADGPARQMMVQVLGALSGGDRSRLAGFSVRLEIIPTDQQLTDLPDFRFLAGRDTFDGRGYGTIRAVGPIVHDSVVVYAVGAEQVVPGLTSAYGPGFAVAHESGHVVRHVALSPGQEATLHALYAARRSAGGPWLTDYASSNDDEYFADGTAAYFGHPWSDGSAGRFTRSWLHTRDPGLWSLLRAVYGDA